MIGLAGNVLVLLPGGSRNASQVSALVGLEFSVAPTVRTFFAVAGLARLSRSTSPSLFASAPSFAAAKRIVMFQCVLALESACIAVEVYRPLTDDPHEFVWTNEPLAAARVNMSSKSLGIPSKVLEPLTTCPTAWNKICDSGAIPLMVPPDSVPSPLTDPAT